jgi:hypothetical protein
MAAVPTSAQAVNPQPQTTGQAAGGPFIRYSEEGYILMYDSTGNKFGGSVTQPLVSAPGYVRRFRVYINATGGVNGTNTVTAGADAPYNSVQQVLLFDPSGTQLIQGGGYEILHLVNKYGGQNGLWAYGDPNSLPSYSAVSTGSSGTGNFTFSSSLPLEAAKGYGTISMANASQLPKIQFTLGSSASVYGTTSPGTVPTVEVKVGAEYYWLPLQSQIQPPGLGSTLQWNQQTGNPPVGSATNLSVTFPRMGGYITTIIVVLRDSTGARIDQFPNPLSLYLDGVPIAAQKPIADIYDDMANQFQLASGFLRETGVLVFTRKDSLNQIVMGLLDTGEGYLSTNPGTSIQIQGTWGTISNAPAQLEIIAGQFVPSGAMLTGLLEN